MAGGGSQLIAKVAAPNFFGSANPADTTAGSTAPNGPIGSVYRPTAPNVYTPALQTQAPSVSPIVQQMASRIAMQNNPYNSGLQSLFSRFNMQQQPMMRGSMQMPQYQNPALSYRPNIQAVQQNLSRVKPSVYKSELDAAKERIAQYEAAEQARQAASDTGYYSGG